MGSAFEAPAGRLAITDAKRTCGDEIRDQAYRLGRAYRLALSMGIGPGPRWCLEAGTLLEMIGEAQ